MYDIIFYTIARDDSPIDDFLDSIDVKARAKVMATIDYLKREGPNLPRPYSDHVRGKIRELRTVFASNQYRILYFFFSQKTIVLLHGFRKKTQRLPIREIEQADQRMKDFLNRYNRGEIQL